MYPANKLIANVDANRQIASCHPKTDVLRKNISGSIDGDAIQNDITGASGTPPISNEVITGITPHEQSGLNAPTMVAKKIATSGFLLNALVMNRDAPDTFTATEIGMVMSR